MSTDLSERIVDASLESLRGGKSFPDVVAGALALAAEALPSPVWATLGDTDLTLDTERFTGWLVRQLEERWPPPDLSGLRFGLYPVRGPRPGRTELVAAVSGGSTYPDEGWLADQPWDPVGYAPTPGLRALLPLSAEGSDEVRAVVGGPLALVYLVGLAVAGFDAVDVARALGGRPVLGVAVGFPDDHVLVGEVTPGGLDRSCMARIARADASDAAS